MLRCCRALFWPGSWPLHPSSFSSLPERPFSCSCSEEVFRVARFGCCFPRVFVQSRARCSSAGTWRIACSSTRSTRAKSSRTCRRSVLFAFLSSLRVRCCPCVIFASGCLHACLPACPRGRALLPGLSAVPRFSGIISHCRAPFWVRLPCAAPPSSDETTA